MSHQGPDEIADVAQMPYGLSAVRIKPSVREGTTSTEGLRADVSLRGVYESRVEASLDIRMADIDDEPFEIKSTLQVLKTHKNEKKRAARVPQSVWKNAWQFTSEMSSIYVSLGEKAVRFRGRL